MLEKFNQKYKWIDGKFRMNENFCKEKKKGENSGSSRFGLQIVVNNAPNPIIFSF
jgi:hypothetical protein